VPFVLDFVVVVHTVLFRLQFFFLDLEQAFELAELECEEALNLIVKGGDCAQEGVSFVHIN